MHWNRPKTQDLLRVAKFAVVGASGVLVNHGILVLCVKVIFPSWEPSVRNLVGSTLAVAVSIFTNFLLNNSWTWSDRRTAGLGALLTRLFRYYIVAGVAGVLQIGIFWGLSVPLGINLHLANLSGIGAGVLINFGVNHFWTFRTNDQPTERPVATPKDPDVQNRPPASRSAV